MLQLNNPPVFCLPSILHLIEGSRKQIVGWIPVSAGSSTTSCSDPHFNAYGQEREQNLTFAVFAEGNLLSDKNSEGLNCSPFDYDHDLEHVRENSWFRINSNGSLDVMAVNSGRTNVTITLDDDGGVEHGGRNTTTQILIVIVQDVNDQPFFDFFFGDVALIYEGTRTPPAVATNISSGRCERPYQLLSFNISILDFCVPDCPNTPLVNQESSANIWRLFDGGSHQLFQGPSGSIAMDPNGTLIFTLEPHRHGRLLLHVDISDGNLHFGKNLTLVVEEVNSPPRFDMISNRVTLHEELGDPNEYTSLEFNAQHMLYRGSFVFSITPGRFDEVHQHLRFGGRSVSNMGLVACLEVVCNESATPGAGCQTCPGTELPWAGEFASCNGTASLRVWATPSRYGDEVVEIFLMDDGPTQPSTWSPYHRAGWVHLCQTAISADYSQFT